MEVENLLQSGSCVKRKRRTFISPSLVLKSFPGIASDVLYQLTELDPPTPTDVLNLIPEATSEQIAQFFDTVSGEPVTSPSSASSQVVSQPAEESTSLADVMKLDQESAEDTRQGVKRMCIFNQTRCRRPS